MVISIMEYKWKLDYQSTCVIFPQKLPSFYPAERFFVHGDIDWIASIKRPLIFRSVNRYNQSRRNPKTAMEPGESRNLLPVKHIGLLIKQFKARAVVCVRELQP
ncbi:uncharacterized protein LOC143237837 [Tachypleus tridentatus]|uniref:uncharacterized protein LOC143237837 n=1 Tax=Tachypleus tridentatus TaxID=6853 RepID=UPI003FD09727